MSLFDKIINAVKTIDKFSGNVSSVASQKSSYLCDTDGKSVMQTDFITRYNLNELREIDNHFYLLCNENVQLATDDIMYINSFIMQASRQHPCFPAKQIISRNLKFSYNKSIRDYSFLSFAPKTPKGKSPKYPVILHFHYDKTLFGTIYYGNDGEIQRAEIIAWENKTCCELLISMNGESFEIDKIYKHNPITGAKQKMYCR